MISTVQIVTATQVVNLHNPFPDNMVVGRWIIGFKGSNGGSYSFVPQKRITVGPSSNASPGSTGPTAPAFANTWYYDALAGPTIVAAGTAITADSIIDVDTSGCDAALNITITSGSLQLFAVPVLG